MRSFTSRDSRSTKIGCRWHALFDICNRSRSHRNSTRSRHTSDFISPQHRAATSVTGIARLRSFGDYRIRSFTLHSVGSMMVGGATGHRRRFARRRISPPSSSLSCGVFCRRLEVRAGKPKQAPRRNRPSNPACIQGVPGRSAELGTFTARGRCNTAPAVADAERWIVVPTW